MWICNRLCGFIFLAALILHTACTNSDQPVSRDGKEARSSLQLLNVSYDPTRELYKEYNDLFAHYWKNRTGQNLVVQMSHGGSGKQARAVIDGLEADVVTLALSFDIDAIREKADLIPLNWQSRLPFNSCPYSSTIVFLVRKGNPLGIKDWGDLIDPGVAVITPNPKTSGGARWNYLAAWGWCMAKELGGIEKIVETKGSPQYLQAEDASKSFLVQLFRQVPVLDTGARGSTNTFVQNRIGDVLLAWENEALLAIERLGSDQFDLVFPSLSVHAEPPVTLIDKVVDRKGTREAAEAYLNYLFNPEVQEILAKYHYRPALKDVADAWKTKFPDIQTFSIEIFGGWPKFNGVHFSDGGLFDQIYVPQN